MALNSQPASSRIRSAQRMVRDARLGNPLSLNQIERLETVLADCASDVEQMEVAAGSAPVSVQLKAAGGNTVMMRAVLRQASARKAAQHG